MGESDGPILYVLVIGFHHKKGCQVEFSYPPIVTGAPNECPVGWKYLPTLALPDGSHNYDEDTVYFHLPSLTNPKQTVYGISCFRQIPVEKIKNKTDDITRGTVQKSVCVLSRIPLYGQIQVKMCLITHAYFEEGDFSKVSILEDTYHHLNLVLMQNDLYNQTFVGLSARDFVMQWKHKAVLLFKLLLLERRVIFFKSPVHPLCSTILTLVSLFPELIEKGLSQSASTRLSRPMSPMPQFSDEDVTPNESPIKVKNINIPIMTDNNEDDIKKDDKANKNKQLIENCNQELNDTIVSTELGLELTESLNIPEKETTIEKNNSLRRDFSADALSDAVQNNINYLAHLNIESCGFPLQVFTKGCLCLPYLSLPYLDLLTDVNVRGYFVGATNVLFKQKKQLYDVFVDIEAGRIECQDLNLRKQLHLTTEDLRFAEYIVKHVSDERHDVFLDGVGWEGGDEWIRTQFRIYLLCLMRTSLLQDGSREIEHFNSNFVSAWRETHNYKIWLSGINPGILDVHAGHPFAGQLSVADMKLRLAHTMQNTESGRKINQAMASTGRAVATTSKAVGGAISQAKGAFSSWWSNLMVNPDQNGKPENETDPSEIPSAKEAGELTTYVASDSTSPKEVATVNGDLTTQHNDNQSEYSKSHEEGEVHTV
ncbi:unnamed protein product [Brassicogethes aeneus]|uniref:UDENN domain-containing protein n=1 Tax=Brassicogethes aeneus TaxID=1431903 RepID=A0A9P0FHW6_BRAAE|nr:unnamed protein product [Brassicogethes aeneus]